MSAPDFGLTPDQSLTLRHLFSGITATGRMLEQSGENLLVQTNQSLESASPVQVTVRTGCFFLGDVHSCDLIEDQYRLRIRIMRWVSADGV